MAHFELGHFGVVARSYLTETAHAHQFALVSHAQSTHNPFDFLDSGDGLNVGPCLELQADHEAIEILFDAYSRDGWDIIRTNAAAISGMMVLIEREDAKQDHELSSHPKAATRIFQLLGHVMDMPMIPAHMKVKNAGKNQINPDDLPSDEEQGAFNQQVVIPAFFDAVHLARIADAGTIISDLGDTADFFRDIQIAKLGNADGFVNLKTAGARQWAELVAFNDTLKQQFGLVN